MATVYLVHDVRHDRLVALKVLRPELGDNGADRFLREIRLTARLQHPHILPVFDSGHEAGQLWYTMPYIEGESLRDRLKREVQLPVDVAVRLAFEIADALEQAHAQGVLHRDIKPENILLSGNHALVADFGLARALTAGPGSTLAGEKLTDAGLAVGTPAYMSPEQLVDGDRVDARSDVYSLACVLYEMFAGEPPHAGPTPQVIVRRRLADPAPSVRIVRDAVPPALDGALCTALARVPADRFESMAAFARALQEAAQSSPGAFVDAAAGPRPIRRHTVRVSILALICLAIAAAGYLILRQRWSGRGPPIVAAGVPHKRVPLLIADFRGGPADSSLAGVLTEVLRIDLAQSPAVSLVPPARIADALARMKRLPTQRLDIPVARELAVREGITAVVAGEVLSVGHRHVVSVQVIAASGGDLILADRETAQDSTELVTVVDRLSRRLRERIGEPLRTIRGDPPLREVTTGSLEALRRYTQAVRAGRNGEIEQQIGLLEQAIELDSGFAMAYTALGRTLVSPYPAERRVWALTKAFELRERLPARERYAASAAYYSIVTHELSKASGAYRAWLDYYPDDVDALGSLGQVYLSLHEYDRAEQTLARALALDSSDVALYLSLIESQLSLGRRPAAQGTVDRMTRAFPGNPEVEWWAIQFMGSTGEYRVAEARVRALRQRHGQEPYWRHWTSATLAALAALRGHLEQTEQFLRDAMAAAEEEGDVRSYHELAGLLAFYDLRHRGQPRRALQEMERALDHSPVDSLSPLDRPYLTLATLYALARQPRRSRAILDEYERAVEPKLRTAAELTERPRQSAYGELALAEGRVEDALDQFREAVRRGTCTLCGLEALGRAYEAADRTDSAIAVYRRRIGTDHIQRLVLDAVELPLIYRRLGDLYARSGDRAQAREYYSRLLDLWKNCDPDLRPILIVVRRRLAELQDGKAARVTHRGGRPWSETRRMPAERPRRARGASRVS
jgi:tetratricopeptide (TPR) repeat protein/TolB-like protein